MIVVRCHLRSADRKLRKSLQIPPYYERTFKKKIDNPLFAVTFFLHDPFLFARIRILRVVQATCVSTDWSHLASSPPLQPSLGWASPKFHQKLYHSKENCCHFWSRKTKGDLFLWTFFDRIQVEGFWCLFTVYFLPPVDHKNSARDPFFSKASLHLPQVSGENSHKISKTQPPTLPETNLAPKNDGFQ